MEKLNLNQGQPLVQIQKASTSLDRWPSVSKMNLSIITWFEYQHSPGRGFEDHAESSHGSLSQDIDLPNKIYSFDFMDMISERKPIDFFEKRVSDYSITSINDQSPSTSVFKEFIMLSPWFGQILTDKLACRRHCLTSTRPAVWWVFQNFNLQAIILDKANHFLLLWSSNIERTHYLEFVWNDFLTVWKLMPPPTTYVDD